MKRRWLAAAFMLTVAMPAVAQESSGPASDEIVVTAPGDLFVVPVAKLLKAVAAFDKDRARLAPQGILWFELSPRDPTKWDGLAATLTDGTTTIPVPLDPNGFSACRRCPQASGRCTRTGAPRPSLSAPWCARLASMGISGGWAICGCIAG